MTMLYVLLLLFSRLLNTAGIFIRNETIHDGFINLKRIGYDRSKHPAGYFSNGTKATDVGIQIFVESLGNYRPSSMDYELDIYFFEQWLDERLKHSLDDDVTSLDPDLIQQLWRPDVYFANSKSAQYNKVTVPNSMVTINRNGNVRLSLRISIKASCHMDLKSYPLDRQMCTLKLLPYGSPEGKVRLSWTEDGIQVQRAISEADLRLYKTEQSFCDGKYYSRRFSCLEAKFYLRRDLSASILHTFIPTFFIVVISWISFWIDPESVPGRVGLAITTLLTFSTQAGSIRSQLPPVSYAKALDIWVIACLLFLFGALVEFAAVNQYSRRSQKIKKRENKDTVYCTDSTVKNADMASHFKKKAETVDKIARLIFPCAFLIFLIIYWSIYLSNRADP